MSAPRQSGHSPIFLHRSSFYSEVMQERMEHWSSHTYVLSQCQLRNSTDRWLQIIKGIAKKIRFVVHAEWAGFSSFADGGWWGSFFLLFLSLLLLLLLLLVLSEKYSMILDLNGEWVDSIMGRILDLASVCQADRVGGAEMTVVFSDNNSRILTGTLVRPPGGWKGG